MQPACSPRDGAWGDELKKTQPPSEKGLIAMSDWTRIGDNDVAGFGKHTFRFEAAEGYYFVVAEESDQEFVQVSHHDNLNRWPIYLKLRQAGCFKLCGMTLPMPGLLSDGS